MHAKELSRSLSSLERKIVPLLKQTQIFAELVQRSGMQEVEVMRALQWLGNKGVIEKESLVDGRIIIHATMTKKGEKYKQERQLPERSILNILEKKQQAGREEIKKVTRLDEEELNAAIGILRRSLKIDIAKEKNDLVLILKNKNQSAEEKLFEQLCENRLVKEKISVLEEKEAYQSLIKRGLLEEKQEKERIIQLTRLGEEVTKEEMNEEMIDQLTPEILKKQEWKGKEFRTFDVTDDVPALQRGKRHFVDQAIEYIKRIWLDLGFKEMQGNMVQTAFWDLDSLFVPQDHPAREMQDTFFVGDGKKVKLGNIPSVLGKKVKAAHEHGGDTGSKGWGGSWAEENAREVLLRTHTTVLSAQTIAQLKKDQLPVKYFTVGKVFRNETLDWKHLFEFYQVEGIVVDPNANFKHLLGYLKEFFKKMGYTDVQIKPSYFGYTEPSAEIYVYHPVKKEWVEIGGAGIFRPEVTKPLLGFECPVLAWGFGMERIITGYYHMSDLREIYKNDLKQLRTVREFMR